jgi:hypothetical protein
MRGSPLTREQKRIAATFGVSPEQFVSSRATSAARRASQKSRWGLSEQQQAICRRMLLSEHSFATAAGIVKGTTPGLMRAHQEIDRAHVEL